MFGKRWGYTPACARGGAKLSRVAARELAATDRLLESGWLTKPTLTLEISKSYHSLYGGQSSVGQSTLMASPRWSVLPYLMHNVTGWGSIPSVSSMLSVGRRDCAWDRTFLCFHHVSRSSFTAGLTAWVGGRSQTYRQCRWLLVEGDIVAGVGVVHHERYHSVHMSCTASKM